MDYTMMTGVGKDIVVGLSVIFLLWVAAILAASSKLIWSNWREFVSWRGQDREMRLRMALWVAIPLLMAGLLWMRAVAVWHYVAVYGIPLISLIQMFVYLPVILVSLALILWWVCNRTFDAVGGDRAWLILVISGFIIGALTTFLSNLL